MIHTQDYGTDGSSVVFYDAHDAIRTTIDFGDTDPSRANMTTRDGYAMTVLWSHLHGYMVAVHIPA